MMNDEQPFTSGRLRGMLDAHLYEVGTSPWRRWVVRLFEPVISRAERAEAERDALRVECEKLRAQLAELGIETETA